MPHIALVLGYFVQFALVQNMSQSSLLLELNFALVLGYFCFLRGENAPFSPSLRPGHCHPPFILRKGGFAIFNPI